MPSEHIDISDQQRAFIRQSISNGQYLDAGEVVRAGLRLLEITAQYNQAKLTAVQNLVNDGFADHDKGHYETITPESLDAFIASVCYENPSRTTPQ